MAEQEVHMRVWRGDAGGGHSINPVPVDFGWSHAEAQRTRTWHW